MVTQPRQSRTEKIRVMCVDDHAVVREGLGMIIDMQPDMAVVASAASGEEAVTLHAAVQPDVTIMDLELPGMDGIAAVAAIRRTTPDARLVVLTMHDDTHNICRALDAGAATYLLKDTMAKTLVSVIRQVYGGARPLSDEIAQRVEAGRQEPGLTRRETELLQLLTEGMSNKELATRMQISDDTVHAHLRSIFTKLKVTDRTAAAMTAVRRGLVRLK